MKKSLIIKYVGAKLAMQDARFAKAKATLTEQDYGALIESLKVSELKTSFKKEMEEKLRSRFGLEKHRSIFYKPSVSEWIADLTGILSVDDIITGFSQVSGIRPAVFRKAAIRDNILDRLFLEDLVEGLEIATGRTLLKDGYWCQDDNYTYMDIAKHFATA